MNAENFSITLKSFDQILPENEDSLSLDTLRDSIIQEKQVSLKIFKNSIDKNLVDYEYLMSFINLDGAYQTRLIVIFLFMIFILSLQLNQMVFMFLPPSWACTTEQKKNLLLTFTNHDIPHHFSKHSALKLIPDQNDQSDKCTTPDHGQCQGVLQADKLQQNNPVWMFRLFCTRRPLRTFLRILVIFFCVLGGFIASSLAKTNLKITLLSLSILFTLCVSVYSISYLGVSIDKGEIKPKVEIAPNSKFMPFQIIGWSPNDLSNLVNFSILLQQVHEENMLIFILFYMGANFCCFGLLTIIFQYMKDFFTQAQSRENRTNFILTISFAQLAATLLKLVIVDWRWFNLLYIAVPSLFLSISMCLVIQKSPYQQLQLLIDQNRTILNKQKEDKQQIARTDYLYEGLYLILKDVAQTNQRQFLTKELLQCDQQAQRNNSNFLEGCKKFRFQVSLTYIFFVLTIVYITPLIIINEIGSSITFNLFSFALSELLALVMSMRFLNTLRPNKCIKYYLLVSGIVGCTITFSHFNDDCNAEVSLCPRKMIELLIMCQMRFFLIFTLLLIFKLLDWKQIVEECSQQFLEKCISISLIGGIIPILLEYLNIDIERIYIITSILIITGSWISHYLK